MHLCCRVALWLVTVAGLPCLALAAQPDWTACAVPGFRDDWRKALAACQVILAQPDLSTTDRERALIIHGRTAHRALQFDSAILDFDEAMRLAPNDPEPVARRGSVAFWKRDYKVAAAFAERALKLNANCAPAFDVLGSVGLTTGNYKLAKAAYDKLVELTPNDPFARFHRFEYLMDIGAQPEALEEIEKVLSLSTTDLDRESRTIRGRELSLHTLARLERATMLQSMGPLSEARQAYDDFVRVDPGEFSYGWRGWYHFDMSEFDLAKADIDKALSYAPDFWFLYHLQGRLYLYAGEYESAVASLTRAISLKPDFPGNSYWSRALALRALHRTEEAKADALWAVTENPVFLRNVIPMLVKLGYYQPAPGGEDITSAVRDAVSARMLDEKCW